MQVDGQNTPVLNLELKLQLPVLNLLEVSGTTGWGGGFSSQEKISSNSCQGNLRGSQQSCVCVMGPDGMNGMSCRSFSSFPDAVTKVSHRIPLA